MKKSIVFRLFVAIALFICLVGSDGCESKPEKSISGAKQVTASEIGFKIPTNKNGLTCEQQNIIDRLRVTTDPTKVMWIHTMGLDGKVIKRMPVRNKVTSSGKRIEPITTTGSSVGYPDIRAGSSYQTNELLQADGTYGSSDNYIFWFDPMGRYHQWGTAGGLGYLLTDYPIDLGNPTDEITGLFNMNKAAWEWQMRQEIELKKKEGVAYEEMKKKVDNLEQKMRENNKIVK